MAAVVAIATRLKSLRTCIFCDNTSSESDLCVMLRCTLLGPPVRGATFARQCNGRTRKL